MRGGHHPLLLVRQWPYLHDKDTAERGGSGDLDMRSAVLCVILPGHDCGDQGASHSVQAVHQVHHEEHGVADRAVRAGQGSRVPKALSLYVMWGGNKLSGLIKLEGGSIDCATPF